MGLLTTIIAYKVGKRSGRRKAERNQDEPEGPDERDPECLNYASFCLNYGSCDGMACEYEVV